MKEATKEVLVATEGEDKAVFESVVKHHKKEFLSDFICEYSKWFVGTGDFCDLGDYLKELK